MANGVTRSIFTKSEFSIVGLARESPMGAAGSAMKWGCTAGSWPINACELVNVLGCCSAVTDEAASDVWEYPRG